MVAPQRRIRREVGKRARERAVRRALVQASNGMEMTVTIAAQRAHAAIGSGKISALGAAQLLAFAAAPTFAIMAVATAIHGDAMPDMICSMSMSNDASLLGGMVPMYVLMSIFHAGPWLKLFAHWRSGMAAS